MIDKVLPANLHRRAIVLMIITTIMWSSAGILTRYLHMKDGYAITFWRSVFAALCVFGVLAYRHGAPGIQNLIRIQKPQFFSGLMWALMFCCFMLALNLTTVANTLLISSLSPLMTACLAYLILKQRVAWQTWLAIGAAFIGMIWMFVRSMHNLDGTQLLGMTIALGVPLSSASNIIILKKTHAHVSLMPSVFWGGIFSALFMLPWTLQTPVDVHDISILATLGFFQLGLPCMLMIAATKSLSAPEVSLLALLEVLLGPIWVWLGVGERPANETLIGGAIVLAALVFNACFTKPKATVAINPQ